MGTVMVASGMVEIVCLRLAWRPAWRVFFFFLLLLLLLWPVFGFGCCVVFGFGGSMVASFLWLLWWFLLWLKLWL